MDNAKDYLVDWVPRPVAKLSPEVQATYEPYNGSHILPPICEGLNDHVDLDLTGEPVLLSPSPCLSPYSRSTTLPDHVQCGQR